jgi:hypothetical protein
MAEKRRSVRPSASQLICSAAYEALSSETKSLLGGLYDMAESAGQDKNDPIHVEAEPGGFVKVRLSVRWRKFGAASPGNVERARRLVDLAEAAFEAGRATKQ